MRPDANEAGLTLVELLVASAMMGLVSMMVMTTLAGVQSSVGKETDRSLTNDAARLAVEQLDREVRSGNLIKNPSAENDPAHGIAPGMALRIYTQTNAATLDPGNRCLQYRIQSDRLERRWWDPLWRTNGKKGAWLTVADHVVNRTVTPSQAAFELDTQSSFGGRVLKVLFVTQVNARSGRTVSVAASITGRNTQYGYAQTICDDIPPY